MIRRTRIERRTPLKRSTKRIRPVALDKQPRQALYRLQAKDFMAKHPTCFRCGKPSQDVHHKSGRIGAHLLDETTWCALCRVCHMYVHEHPSWARENGYLT